LFLFLFSFFFFLIILNILKFEYFKILNIFYV
jgi:hypothetical protein